MSSSAAGEPVSSKSVRVEDETGHRSSRSARAADGAGVETAIVLQMTAALLTHPPTELTVIEVNNRQGIVTLKGEVSSVQLYDMAGAIASRYPGVDATVNALEVHGQPASDGQREA